MPKLTKNRISAYRRHKARNIAVVTSSGENFYLGPYGSEASKAEFDRVVAEWIANGRCVRSSCAGRRRLSPSPRSSPPSGDTPRSTTQRKAFPPANNRLLSQRCDRYDDCTARRQLQHLGRWR